MKNFFKEYFSFSSGEKNGILVLVLLIFVLILVWKFMPFYSKESNFQDKITFEKEIYEFEKSIIIQDTVKYSKANSDSINLFKFNPNLITDEDWNNLGLNPKQIKIIRHYQEKGGSFKNKEDFKKMYCLRSGQYELLESYIEIPSQIKKDPLQKLIVPEIVKMYEFDPNCTAHEEWKAFGLTEKQINVIDNFLSKGGKFKTKEDFKKIYCIQPQLFNKLEPYIAIVPEPIKPPKFDPDIRVDINNADSSEFRKIKGINPYLAKNIVKYRKSLGGFLKKRQMLEVWGFKSDLYNSIEQNFVLNNMSIKRLNINTSTFGELIKHPYFNYEITKSLIQYRKIIGKIKSSLELLTNKIIPDSTLNKINPYIVFE